MARTRSASWKAVSTGAVAAAAGVRRLVNSRAARRRQPASKDALRARTGAAADGIRGMKTALLMAILLQSDH